MQRDLYNTVTIPVLIPCLYEERDGMVNLASPNATRQVTLASLQPVRALQDEDFAKGSKFWSEVPAADKDKVLALIGLRQALEGNDRLSVEKREKAYLKIMPELLAPMPDSKRGDFHAAMARVFAQHGKSLSTLERVLTHALRDARLILWRQEERLLPAIYCPNATTAVYVRALVKIAGANALSVCPRCGNPFLQQRPDQDYCSIRCREAHRVARWRATHPVTVRHKRGRAAKRNKALKRRGRT